MQIYEAIPKVAKSIGAIAKTRKNEQQGFRFRGIDDVYSACHGPMIEHGVFCTTEVVDLQRSERQSKTGSTLLCTLLRLKVTFYAADGSSVSTVTAGEAMDSGDKSCSKALSMAMKYAFFQTFVIPLEEDDADATTHELAPSQQQKMRAPRQTKVEPKQELPPEQKAFNEFVKPLLDGQRLTRDMVVACLKDHGGDYAKAREYIEGLLKA